MGTGRIKHWNDEKGYGFIQADNGGKDVFFHISTWQNSERPQLNQIVDFEINLREQKRSALWVRLKGTSPTGQSSYRSRTPKKAGRLKETLAALMIAVGSLTLWQNYQPTANSSQTAVLESSEDQQINQTIYLIKQGGPFPYAKDGTVFQNREKHLPIKNHGYYHEYTVPTPGLSHRGARRIVTGGNPPIVYYYTADHYRSFRQLDVSQ